MINSSKYRLIEFSPETFAVVQRRGSEYFHIVFSQKDYELGRVVTILNIRHDDFSAVGEAMEQLLDEAFPNRLEDEKPL